GHQGGGGASELAVPGTPSAMHDAQSPAFFHMTPQAERLPGTLGLGLHAGVANSS
ncbi:unnamed protein product, partial [Amoebophrya sp. A25]